MSNVVTMSTEVTKASVRRFYDEVFNKKNRAAIDEFIPPNHVDHPAPPVRQAVSRVPNNS